VYAVGLRLMRPLEITGEKMLDFERRELLVLTPRAGRIGSHCAQSQMLWIFGSIYSEIRRLAQGDSGSLAWQWVFPQQKAGWIAQQGPGKTTTRPHRWCSEP